MHKQDTSTNTGTSAMLNRRSFLTRGATATTLAALGLAGAGGNAALLSGCATTPGSGSQGSTPQAGTRVGVGKGMGKHGSVTVEVELANTAIERITVLGSRETPGLGNAAIDKLTALITNNQTLNVDTITGATLSSMAFTTAVAEALDELGQDASEWKRRENVRYVPTASVPKEADVVVVGSGGAGLAATITAANAGKSVVLLEKMGVLGGDTALSGGEMAAPGNWIQLSEGVVDSPAALAQDMLKGGDFVGDPALVQIIAEGALDSSQWLTFEGGVSWKHDLMFFGGHSIKRSLIPLSHSGSEMTTKLSARAFELPQVTVLDSTRASSLVLGADGRVSSVELELADGKTVTLACKAVVLACGGFGSNVEMRKQYNPEMDESLLSTDCVGATGDGLLMASAIGAELIDMQHIQTYPVCDPINGGLLYVGDMRLESRAIMINKEGRRFVEELERRDVLSRAIKGSTDGQAYMLFNQKEADETGLLKTHADEYENLESRGVIVKGSTLDEVCKPFGVDAATLAQTVETWNRYCAQGTDPEFHYRSKLVPIEGGPYYLMAYKPAVHYTMGGLHINTQAEVLDTSGQPLPGLFAAGEVAGHKMGTNRLGSCSMSDIFTFGRIAGKNAAAFASQ